MPVKLDSKESVIFPKLEVLIFPQLDNPFTLISKLTKTVTTLVNCVSTIFTALEPSQIAEYVKQGQIIQRQMLDIFPSSQAEFYSRLNLRLLLGLPLVYEEDSGAMRSLEGAVTGITKEKINVTKIIRKLRGSE